MSEKFAENDAARPLVPIIRRAVLQWKAREAGSGDDVSVFLAAALSDAFADAYDLGWNDRDNEAPTPEQAERARLESTPGDTYPDGRPKMHRHSMSFDVHRDDECDRGVLPNGTWATSRRRVYVFDDDVLDAHERHIIARALAAALEDR